MVEFNFVRFLQAFGIGMLTTVGFDAIIHGLSHSGHGIIDKFWKEESAQRVENSFLFGSIVWHIIADIIIALFLTMVVIALPNPNILTWLKFGILFGCLMSAQWVHMYAAFQIGGRISFVLSVLTISQASLATILIGWSYFGA